LKGEFFSRVYPKVKLAGARRTITNFKNRPSEGLVRAYKRYKSMIRKCPHHDLPPWNVLHIFYGGLNQDNKKEIVLTSGRPFMDFTVTQAWELIEQKSVVEKLGYLI
jgi:hypothetical protein